MLLIISFFFVFVFSYEQDFFGIIFRVFFSLAGFLVLHDLLPKKFFLAATLIWLRKSLWTVGTLLILAHAILLFRSTVTSQEWNISHLFLFLGFTLCIVSWGVLTAGIERRHETLTS